VLLKARTGLRRHFDESHLSGISVVTNLLRVDLLITCVRST
jgi:hypothetical protein